MKVRKNIVKFLLGVVISSQLIFSPITVYADTDTTVDTGTVVPLGDNEEWKKAQAALNLSDSQVSMLKTVYKWLIEYNGYKGGAAAGILGNIYAESKCVNNVMEGGDIFSETETSASGRKYYPYSDLGYYSDGGNYPVATKILNHMRGHKGWGLFQLTTDSIHLEYSRFSMSKNNYPLYNMFNANVQVHGENSGYHWSVTTYDETYNYTSTDVKKMLDNGNLDAVFWGNWNKDYDKILANNPGSVEAQRGHDDSMGFQNTIALPSILQHSGGNTKKGEDFYFMCTLPKSQVMFFTAHEEGSYATYHRTVENYISKQNRISDILHFPSDFNAANLNLEMFKNLDGSEGAAYAGAIFAMCCERSGMNNWINDCADAAEHEGAVSCGFYTKGITNGRGNVSRVYVSQLMYTLMENTTIQPMDDVLGALGCASYEMGMLSEDAFAKEMKLSEKDWESVIANANIDNFSNAQLTELVDWQQRIDNNDKDIIDWARIAVAAIGTLLIFWGIIMYLSYWFDTVNTLFPIDLMPIVSLGKLEVLNSDETTFSLTKGAEKGQKVTVNHKNVATISLLLVGAGVIILSGVLYQLITMIYTFAKTKLQS